MSTYKPSKAPWLARIPNTWSEAPLFTFFRDNKTKNIGMAEANVLSLSYGTIKRRDVDSGMGLLPESFETYQIVEPGDIVLRLTDLQNDQRSLRTGLVKERGIVTSAYLALRPSKYVNPRFAHYLLHSLDTMKVYYGLGAGVRQTMKYSDLSGAYLAMPMRVVQTQIADYLDSETARIDALIDRKQRFIDLLLERRSAIIAHAVTKGLDPVAEMKDSGHDELGMIPAHWRVMRVRHLFRNLDGCRIPLSAEERSYRQGDYDYYGASGIIDHIDDYIFDEPLVLIGEDGANLLLRSTPLAFVATGKYWVNNHAHVMRPLHDSPHYWAAALNVIDYTPLIVGSAQPKLTQGDLADVPLPVPPPAEIAAICAYIEREAKGIDKLAKETRRSIDLLREYRTALISAAVTGQIDIPGTETSEDGA